MKATPINDRRGVRLFLGSEKNRPAEEPLEAFDEAAIVGAVLGKMKEVEHLSGRIEMKLTGFLPDSKCGHPDGDEAVLAKRQPVVRTGDDVKKKLTIAPAMDDLAGRRTA
jgi:hypothetical protein